jgi:hypothetical protein
LEFKVKIRPDIRDPACTGYPVSGFPSCNISGQIGILFIPESNFNVPSSLGMPIVVAPVLKKLKEANS